MTPMIHREQDAKNIYSQLTLNLSTLSTLQPRPGWKETAFGFDDRSGQSIGGSANGAALEPQ